MCAQKAAQSASSNNNYFIRLIGLILCIGAVVTVSLLIINIIGMGIVIAPGPILIAILVDIALVVLPFYLFASGKANYNNILRFGSFAIAAMMLFVNLFVSSYLDLTEDFLKNTYSPRSQGAVEYSVVAQRAAGIELSKNKSVRAGIQSSDSCKQEAERETKRLADASFTEYENVSELIGATEEKAVDVAVVQSAMLTAFAEYFPDSYDNLRVLTTFKAGSDASKANAAGVKVDITKPFVIYVSGLDGNGPIEDCVSRSDSNILVYIDPEHYRLLLITTPRDYYVQLHGTTGIRDKLCHSGMYGIEMSEATLEDLYGINIDYHVRTNFDTLVNFVDAMGGIVVDNPTPFHHWGSSYAEGEIYLNGYYALMYARARYIAGGDNTRGENQQRVIEAIVSRLTKPQVVVHYKSIIQSLSGTFQSNIPPKVVAQLFSRQISLGGDWTIEKISATGTEVKRSTYSMGEKELEVIIPNEDSLDEIKSVIKDFLRGSR